MPATPLPLAPDHVLGDAPARRGPRRREPCCVPAGAVLPKQDAQQAADDLGILANPIRLQLLAMLMRRDGEVCVCDLEAAVDVKQPTVSHHLKLLREADLITSEKRGAYAYYRADRAAVATLRARIADQLGALG